MLTVNLTSAYLESISLRTTILEALLLAHPSRPASYQVPACWLLHPKQCAACASLKNHAIAGRVALRRREGAPEPEKGSKCAAPSLE